jgi:4-diphosphocytidyl-2-C-methyl-D-erythritol kinase
MITLKAPAKINLTLEVLGRRDDGYHDIVSVMQAIDLCDEVKLEPADEIALECSAPELQSDDNLALRAARMLAEVSGHPGGAHIILEKEVPVASGLGGGSSDAAAVLKGLNALWGLGLSLDDLSRIAARLGSDVSFFLHGGTCLAQGRGETVRPLPPADIEWMVVLAPRIEAQDKTASAYARMTESAFTKGALTRKLAARIQGGGDVPPQFLFNAFDAIALDVYPGLDRYWKTLSGLGAREIHVAGSGPSLYAPVSRREVGTAIQLLLTRTHGWDAFLVSPLPRTGESPP